MTKEEYLAAVEALRQLYIHADSQITDIENKREGELSFCGFSLDGDKIDLGFFVEEMDGCDVIYRKLAVPKD